MPDPLTPGRTTTRTRKHARVAWASLCALLSDTAALSVPTRGDRQMDPDYYVTVARRFKLISQAAQFYGVAVMREEGKSWGAVACACGLPDAEAARAIYEAKYKAFVRGEKDPWAVPGVRGAVPDGAALSDPDVEAARLDEWCHARGLADGPLVPGLLPVTDGLY